jgi:hypothetical protein
MLEAVLVTDGIRLAFTREYRLCRTMMPVIELFTMLCGLYVFAYIIIASYRPLWRLILLAINSACCDHSPKTLTITITANQLFFIHCIATSLSLNKSLDPKQSQTQLKCPRYL